MGGGVKKEWGERIERDSVPLFLLNVYMYVCMCGYISSLGDEENEEDKIMSKEEAGVVPSDQEDSSDSEGEEDGVCLLEGQAPIATKKGKKKSRTKRRKTKEVPSSVAMRQEVRAGPLSV